MQWEYQVGPSVGIEAGDHIWISRYLLEVLQIVIKDFLVSCHFGSSILPCYWSIFLRVHQLIIVKYLYVLEYFLVVKNHSTVYLSRSIDLRPEAHDSVLNVISIFASL